MKTKTEVYAELIKSLPPLVAAVAWDVVNLRITLSTVELANQATDEEYKQYNLIRCVAAANPNYPPIELAMGLIEEMMEKPGK